MTKGWKTLELIKHLHDAALTSFYAHQLIWWGVLVLTGTGTIVSGYVMAKRDTKAGDR